MKRLGPGRQRVVVALLVVGCLMPTGLAAHRAHVSLTTVEWNRQDGSLEVIHRFHLHDAQRILDALAPESNLALADLEGRARFALYTEAGFGLWREDEKTELQLELVGAEIEGDHILVFREIELPEPPSALRVKCTLLRDLFEDQVGHVNLRISTRTRTLRFAGEDLKKLVQFH